MTTPDDPPAQRHPAITTIEDTLTFKIARFAAINARDGSVIFRDAFGLTLNEWRVLGLVAAHAPLGLQELAERVLMDKGQLSRTVARLVERGKLVNEISPDDARKVTLTLTPFGAQRHAEVLAFARDRNEEVLGVLTPDEARMFVTLLDRLLAFNEAFVRASGNLDRGGR